MGLRARPRRTWTGSEARPTANLLLFYGRTTNYSDRLRPELRRAKLQDRIDFHFVNQSRDAGHVAAGLDAKLLLVE